MPFGYDLPAAATDFIQEFRQSEQITVKTSGSTGLPRLISLEKGHMIASARMTLQFFNLQKGDTALLCLPVDFIAGKMMIVRSLVGDLSLLALPPSANPLKDLHLPVHFAAMTPMQVLTGLRKNPEKFDLVEQLIIGGGSVGDDLISQLQTLPTRCWSTYGMTETITHVAARLLNGVHRQDCYNALPGVLFSTDERSCLVIDVQHLGVKSLLTNDMVELMDETSFRWLARYDNVVNSGTVKLHPEVIEAKLRPYLKRPFFLAGESDALLGERLILLIEGPENASAPNEIIWQEAGLTRYEIPKRILYLPAFQYTPTQKIDRLQTLAGL